MGIKEGGKYRLDNWLLPVVAILLTALVLQLLYSRRQFGFEELCPENGVLDAAGADFSDRVYNVQNRWDYYPDRLYGPEDFASGVDEEPKIAGEDISANDVRFGTYRLVLKAKPEEFLSLCGFSLDYGTRIFVNGAETVVYGNVADNADEAVPAGGYMTIPIWTGKDGEAEIICQYSNFVHKEGGYIPALYLSSTQNIEEYKEGNALASVGLSAAMLILALYFLLCAAVQRLESYLCLAFCCLLMALRDNLFWGSFLLPPDISWQFTYRTSLTVASLMPMAFLLLLRSIYPTGLKQVHYAYICAIAADVLLLILLDTKLCVLFCRAAYYISVPYFICQFCGIAQAFRKKTFDFRAADAFVISGMSVYLAALLAEALLSGRSSFATRFGLTPGGMLICLLLIAVSVSLRVQEQKAALAESRSRSEMLERMNALNMDFLHKVAHELKTPLTVISGYAQLAGMQIAGNGLSSEAHENLETIRQEAMRLADLVTNLMDYSYGRQSETAFGTVETGPLLDSVQAICTPMCLKNKNCVVIGGRECADVYGSKEMLLQIFINLIVNANRHTQNGTITVSASDAESGEFVIFRVEDTGCGLSEEAKQHLFEKGFSGDGSSGLGLSVCREAAEAHGGKIELEKTGPDGTVFAFSVLKRSLER